MDDALLMVRRVCSPLVTPRYLEGKFSVTGRNGGRMGFIVVSFRFRFATLMSSPDPKGCKGESLPGLTSGGCGDGKRSDFLDGKPLSNGDDSKDSRTCHILISKAEGGFAVKNHCGFRFHLTVREISNPTGETCLERGLVDKKTESYALNSSGDLNSNGLHGALVFRAPRFISPLAS
jgi:hypothetical protein